MIRLRNIRWLPIAWILVASCWPAKAAEPPEEAAAHNAAVTSDRADSAAADAAPVSFSARGVVQPAKEITIRSAIAARVSAVRTGVGQRVEQGQVLVELDAANLRYQEAEARDRCEHLGAERERLSAALDQLQEKEEEVNKAMKRAQAIIHQLHRITAARQSTRGRRYAAGPPLFFDLRSRRRTTARRNAVPSPLRDLYLRRATDALEKVRAGRTRLRMESSQLEQQRDELDEALALAQSAWKTAREARTRYASVTAPSSGTISACPVCSVDRVSTGEVMLKIIQTDRVRVFVWIPSNRLADGNPVVSARIRETGAEDGWATAKLVGIASLPDPRTGQYLAEFELDNHDNGFDPGSIVDAKVIQATLRE